MENQAQEWFDCYKAARGPALRKSSQTVYGAWWKKYTDFLAEHRAEAATAGPELVRAFLDEYSGNTRIRYFRLLLSVYEVAAEHELCSVNHLADMRGEYEGEEERVTVTTLPAEALEKLYSIKPGRTWKRQRDRALVLLTAEAGLRRRELLALGTSHLHLDAIPPRVAVVSAGKLQRDIPLSARLAGELRKWLEARASAKLPGNLVFPAGPAGDGLNPSTVYRIIERHLAQVGAGKETLGKSGARILRATAAQQEQAKGTELPELQAKLGHRQLMSTADLVSRLQTFGQPDSTNS